MILFHQWNKDSSFVSFLFYFIPQSQRIFTLLKTCCSTTSIDLSGQSAVRSFRSLAQPVFCSCSTEESVIVTAALFLLVLSDRLHCVTSIHISVLKSYSGLRLINFYHCRANYWGNREEKKCPLLPKLDMK